ncbi:MAG: hypothetical protein RIC55_03080 [Pirellulaceae bacterium]
MASDPTNPYEPAGSAGIVPGGAAALQRWPVVLCACTCSYFLVSALTLPFVNEIWFGEAPPLAIVQLPKSFFKSLVHHVLLSMINWLGLSRGSPSPDYIATHGWAMIATVSVPALLVIMVLSLMQSSPRRRLIGAILICAALDAVVTLWFDSASSLKLFNAIYL